MSNIADHFPLPTPRPKQLKAMEYVQRARDEGFTDIVLEAPTGFGKTAVSAAICRWAATLPISEGLIQKAGGYVLVLQKVLQDQLANDLGRFSGGGATAKLIKSAVEYTCPNYKKCSIGMAKKCECLKEGACAYRRAKVEFLNAEVAVTNYAYFLTEREHVGELVNRTALCLDEASHLLKVVTSYVGLTVNKDALKDYAPDLDAEELHKITELLQFAEWVRDRYAPAAKERAGILMAIADQDERIIQKAFEIQQHADKAASFASRILGGDTTDWVFWQEDGRKKGDINLSARPLTAKPYFEALFKGFPLRVYLSAYPGSKGIYCRELGLDPKRVAWLRLSSTFPVENRPVHLLPVGSLGRKNYDAVLPSVLKLVIKILDQHKDRGLIHTHSYALADAVVESLRQTPHFDRLIYPKTAEERTDALAQHAATEGAVLVSPSIYEGFDFHDDLARWAIVVKCPWPSLGDKQVAARSERDPDWYAVEALKAIVQACGRIVRSETDHGVVYVLDEDARRLLRDYKSFVPPWFSEAVICH